MNTVITNYTFSASAKTITLIDIVNVDVKRVRFIKNLTLDSYIYDFTSSLVITASTNVITFTGSNAGMADSDVLSIQYDLDSKEKYIDYSFSNVGSGLLTSDFTQLAIGTGMAVNQSAGNLVVTTGTTVNSELVIRGVNVFRGALTLKEITTLSQRIINNNFFIELVDVIGDSLAYNIVSTVLVDVTKTAHGFTAQNVGQRMDLCALSSVGVPMEGVIQSIPDANTIRFTVAGYPASGSGTLSLTGWNKTEILYSSTVATNLLFNTRRKGWQNTAFKTTINTSVSGHLVSLNAENGITSLADKTLVSGNALSNRAVWDTNIPQQDTDMYVQLRAKNGTVAPATTTTWTIGMIRVEEYSPSQVSIVSTRQQTLNNSLPVVTVAGSISTVSGTATVTQGAAGAAAWLANPLIPVAANSGDTGAKVATGNGATLTNTTGKGISVTINLGAVTGTLPTAVFKIQFSNDAGTTWLDLPNATTATITTTGVFGITVYPSITTAVGTATTGSVALVNSVMPRTYRFVWTIGGTTPSFTITNIQVTYLL